MCKSCKINPIRCITCHRCGSCCRCKLCSACNKHHPAQFPWTCQFCKRCVKSCYCRDRVGAIDTSMFRPKPTEAVVNKLRRLVGLEVELATWGTVQEFPFKTFKYHVDQDASVYPSGTEMVGEPLGGDKFLTAMFELGRALSEGGAEVNDSCGLHIHVDAMDLGAFEIRRLVELYTKMEGEIYRLVGVKRAGSSMCKPWKQKGEVITRELRKAMTGKEIRDKLIRQMYDLDVRKKFKSERATKFPRSAEPEEGIITRYRGLNLHSFFYRGTVEWRMHEGTTDLGELLNWPLFCGWFVELVYRMTDKEAEKIQDLRGIVRRMPRVIWEWVEEKLEARGRWEETQREPVSPASRVGCTCRQCVRERME
mgnify:CR=1 FL=1